MKHTGNMMFTVTCVSPSGERRIQFRYHFWSDGAKRISAVTRARAKKAAYQKQGWSVFEGVHRL